MRYILLTGADIGNKLKTLQRASELINTKVGGVIGVSSVYESAPWGFKSDTTFLNQAILLDCKQDPEQLLTELQNIELELGRVRKSVQWVSRTIDIDILCSESLTYTSDKLSIPHLLLHEREFALQPLCELAPDWQHPLLGKSYSELLSNLAVRTVNI